MSSQPGKPLIVIGSGGHAKVLIATARAAGRSVLFATDSQTSRHGSMIDDVVVAGDDSFILKHSPDEVELVNAIGSASNLSLRYKIGQHWTNAGYRFATLIHPSAIIEGSVQLGSGVQCLAGVVLQTDLVIGNETIINTKASVDHDCIIGNCVHISPGATLCGSITVGDRTHIGAGSTIIQGVRIGSDVLIGAGAVVLKDVANGATVVGVPARPLRSSH